MLRFVDIVQKMSAVHTGGNNSQASVSLHATSSTDLVSALLGTQTQIRNVHGLSKTCLRWCIKDCIERDVLEKLVHSEFVGVDNHGCGWSQREGRRYVV